MTLKRPIVFFALLASSVFGAGEPRDSGVEAVLFQPQPSSYQDNHDIIKMVTKDGVQISALYLVNPKATNTMIYSHGNAEDLGNIRPFLNDLQNIGFSVLAYDYHGYGTSGGKPSEENVYVDVDAAYHYLTDKQGIPPESIIIYGRSLGGGPSVDLASRKPVGGLILESVFTSALGVMLKRPDPNMDMFRNLEKIPAVKCPVLMIHGKADKVIPFTQGQSLFDAVKGPKQHLWIETAGHNDIGLVARQERLKSIQDFADLIREIKKKSIR